MATKLRQVGWFRRQTIEVEPHQLLLLQPEWGSDRVRRVLFDRVSTLVVWRVMPWDRIIVVLILLGVPTTLLLSLGSDDVTLTIGGIFLGIALLLVRYVVVRRTHFAVARADTMYRFNTIAGSGKVDRFVDELVKAIETVQAAHETITPQTPQPATDDEPSIPLD